MRVKELLPIYPEFTDITREMRSVLHPLFQQLREGVSEMSFAGLYLFRETHRYQISLVDDSIVCVSGDDDGSPFFMLPFGLPNVNVLRELFERFGEMKAVSETYVEELRGIGATVVEDRDNFDYLYDRQKMADLPGSALHKKRNLVNAFINNYTYQGRPLLDEYLPDALKVLDDWRGHREDAGDYDAAREGLERMDELQLCGGIYYVEGVPAAYSLGEENACGSSFVVHFVKADSQYKGIYQFVNQCFSAILPDKYSTINWEQDLGNPGLRQAKESYKPIGFVKKFRARFL